MKWTKKQAREFLVNYHMINSNNHYSIRDVFNRIKSIQYDPLNVVGTNPELVLQARVHNFKKDMLYDALYKERYLVDGWDKQMCIYEVKDFHYFNKIRENMANIESSFSMNFSGLEFKHIIDEVYSIIEENGPISSSKIKLGERKKHKWGSNKASSVAISYLFHKGLIGVDSRNNTQKNFDLIQRVHPNINSINPFTTEEDFIEYYLLRRIKSLGLVWNKSSVAFSGLHINKKSNRSKYFKSLTEKGLITEVSVVGMKEELYIPTEALNYPIDLNDRITILAPLDNILWDRALVKELFNFTYTWEVYVPKTKRKYGYYVLPLIRGSEIIGRIEFDKQRNSDPLKIINLWLEPSIEKTNKMDNELDLALNKFSKYLGIGPVSN